MKSAKYAFFLFLFFLIIQNAISLPVSSAQEASLKSSGRACLTVEETSPEGQVPAVHITAFDQNAKPGPGKRLILYADANTDGFILVTAFNAQDHGLANGWQVQWAEIKAWEELSLPATPVTWSWAEGSEPFEIYVVFFKKNFEGLADLTTLIAAMQDPANDAKLLDLQAKKLYEDINRWMQGENPAAFHAGAMPSAWGGTLRGIRFPWRQQAQKALLSDNGPGFLIYRYGV